MGRIRSPMCISLICGRDHCLTGSGAPGSNARVYRGMLRLTALTAILCTAPWAHADEKPEQSNDGSWFVGFSVFPVTSDETFGAGLGAGWTRDWYAFTWRESFLMSPNRRVSDSALERVQRRLAFELTAEAVLRIDTLVLYGGAGGGVRHDRRARTELVNDTFSESSHSQLRVRPVLTVGLIGKLVEANVSLFFDGAPDLRMGLGVTLGR